LTCDDVDVEERRVVKVRLFAALREIAGASEVEADGRNAGDVVDVLSSRYGERFTQIAAVGTVVVNGERATRSTPVAEGDEVALLPPVSGGSPMRNSGP
jgi:MoaD family protein